MSAKTPEARLAFLRLCWAALAPIPLLLLATSFIAQPVPNPKQVPLPVLTVLAVVFFAVSMIMPRHAARAHLARFPIPPTASPDEKLVAAYQGCAAGFQGGIGPALAIAALGLTALMFASAGWLAAPFFVASYLALALQFPTREKALALLVDPKR